MACFDHVTLKKTAPGSTSSAMPWPKDHIPKELTEDERLEKMMKKFQHLGMIHCRVEP